VPVFVVCEPLESVDTHATFHAAGSTAFVLYAFAICADAPSSRVNVRVCVSLDELEPQEDTANIAHIDVNRFYPTS